MSQLKAGVSGMKIGLIKEALAKSSPEVAAAVRKAADELQEAGAIVEEVSLETFDVGEEFFKEQLSHIHTTSL